MPNIAITKRVDLSDVADGWNDCYAIVTMANYKEGLEFSNLDRTNLDNEAAYKFQSELVSKHFVSGKVMTFDEAGSIVLADLEADKVNEYMAISNQLFYAIVGVTLDPKDTSTATETSPTLPPSNEL